MSRAYRKWKEIIKECRRSDLVFFYGGVIITGNFGSSLADYRRLRRLRQTRLRRWKYMEMERERFFQNFRRHHQMPGEYVFEEH